MAQEKQGQQSQSVLGGETDFFTSCTNGFAHRLSIEKAKRKEGVKEKVSFTSEEQQKGPSAVTLFANGMTRGMSPMMRPGRPLPNVPGMDANNQYLDGPEF